MHAVSWNVGKIQVWLWCVVSFLCVCVSFVFCGFFCLFVCLGFFGVVFFFFNFNISDAI